MSTQLAKFDEECYSLMNAGFATAPRHIAQILKVIAGANIIMNAVGRCTQSYDFETEFNRSKAPFGMNGYRLVPPNRISDFVAYAFGILLHIDLGDLDLTMMLTTYFKDVDINTSFQRFCSEIVDKFRRSVATLIEDKAPETVQESAPVTIDGDAVSEVSEALSECVAVISSMDLPVRQKEELLVITDALKQSLSTGNTNLTYVVYIGFKYAVGSLKDESAAKYAEIVSNLMRRYGLVA